MPFQIPPQYVWIALMLGISAFALWKGGRPERIFAVVNVAASQATRVARDFLPGVDVQTSVLVIDLVLLGVLLYLALTEDRWWLMFASAFQLVGLATHAAIMADESVAALPYRWGLVIWSYLVLFSFGLGAWLHWRGARSQVRA